MPSMQPFNPRTWGLCAVLFCALLGRAGPCWAKLPQMRLLVSAEQKAVSHSRSPASVIIHAFLSLALSLSITFLFLLSPYLAGPADCPECQCHLNLPTLDVVHLERNSSVVVDSVSVCQ